MNMIETSRYKLDILSCIANLSSDEVFTPPQLAIEVLDQLEAAWARDSGGKSIWENPEVKFLDPCSKTGVFLREITRRLNFGLSSIITDPQTRINHILKNQVFGIGITSITALISRRSVYCSKFANGKHSICSDFADADGNIWFQRTEHEWSNNSSANSRSKEATGSAGKCIHCGAAKVKYDRGDSFETYAYAFLHTDNIVSKIEELFGEKMHFDVVIGNPPYQLGSDGGTRDVPIYNKFVEQAKALEPKYLTMIIPSRWMSTGLGLNDFRDDMLNDSHMQSIVDYPNSKEVFDGVDVKGGVCYFLWSLEHEGLCEVTQVRNGEASEPQARSLNEYDVLVRDPKGSTILRKVLKQSEESVQSILSSDKQFGWTSNHAGFSSEQTPNSIPVYCKQGRTRQIKFIDRAEVTKSPELLKYWKLLVPKAASEGGRILPDTVLGQPWIAESDSACTQTFLFFMFDTKSEVESFESYYKTKFFRYLVSLRKITQDAPKATYRWVPMQTWDRRWTDQELFTKYGLSEDEMSHIEAVVKPIAGEEK